ncbi:hypothetical protein NYE24_00595 [Paenibacillus sp. FSL H7-0350]|uniref:hypothetical protein n=1 Tax=Paenibacillus sp. FSL H7-0350 TaxID=2975345 RepID=UPI0031580878
MENEQLFREVHLEKGVKEFHKWTERAFNPKQENVIGDGRMLDSQVVKEGYIKGAQYSGYYSLLDNGTYMASVVAVEPGPDAFGEHRTRISQDRETAINNVLALWNELEKEFG